MLEGPVKFTDRKTKTKGKRYFQLVLYIPKAIAQDSQFPFTPGEVALLKIEGEKVVLSKIHKNIHHKELLAP
jgi:hypothetical protein